MTKLKLVKGGQSGPKRRQPTGEQYLIDEVEAPKLTLVNGGQPAPVAYSHTTACGPPPPAPRGFYAAKQVLDGETYWFASLDGKQWREVALDPRPFSRPEVEVAIGPDANGWSQLPMGLQYLRLHGPVEIFPPEPKIRTT